MIHILLFNAVLVIACGYALIVGGAPERLTAATFLLGAAATFAVPFQPRQSFYAVHGVILAIDVVMLAVLVAIALRADRYWPLYVSSLHLITIAIHGVKAYEPTLVPWMYAAASAKIAYPMLLLLLIGAVRHRDRRVRFGSDPDWSSLDAIEDLR
jgi:hypothetical protein